MMRYLKQTPTNSDTEQLETQSESSEEQATYTYEELKKSMEEAQKKHFGYKNLKDFQIEAVQAAFHKKDSFLVMATGMGKSLCYQIPSIMKEAKKKFTIVISPLISLMKDQVDNLNRKNISAVYLGSGQKGNTNNILTQIKHGVYSIIYCSPEYALNNKNLFSMLRKRILLIAIDEVHCMSEWGHDFRPAYRKLNELKKIVTGIPFMCLTATCTKNVQDDIIKNLEFDLNTCLVKRSSVNKKNLFYFVRIKTEIYKDLKDILDIPPKATATRTKRFVDNSKICPYNSTLIYVNSKKECEEIYDFLKSRGLLVGTYHADMSNNDKMTVHEQFLKDEIQIVVATVAFGMGIDKPDIRRIIHYGFSRSLEGYVQQVGRAGRDNGDAEAILFFNMVDESKTKNIIIRENMANQQIVTKFERVQHIINMFTDASDYAYSSICRRKKIYEYFDEQPKETDDIRIFDDERNKGVCFFVSQWDTYLCAKCDNCFSYMNAMKKENEKKSTANSSNNSKFSKASTNGNARNDTTVQLKVGAEVLEDFSSELLTLLKCVSSLNGRTGSSTIHKILTKSKESSIIKKKYHELEVYGRGSHRSTQWWSAFMKIVRNDKYIKETLNCGNDMGYVSIGLAEKGEMFLKKKDEKYLVNIPDCLMSLLGKADKMKGATKKKEIEREKPRFHYMEDTLNNDSKVDDIFSKSKKDTTNFAEYSFTKSTTNTDINKREENGIDPYSTSRNNTNGISVNELNVKKTTKENNKEAIDKYRYFNADKSEMTKKEETVKKLTTTEINDKIMSILLRTRMLEARKQNIPPFQLISDQPLKDICHMRLSTVQLIRKHVDNISPICPNSFLEKLVQGIRGFCLLYEIETDVNIKQYSQNSYESSGIGTPSAKESSVNKFDSLISSFAYGNVKKEERFANASIGNSRNESVRFPEKASRENIGGNVTNQNFPVKNIATTYNNNNSNYNYSRDTCYNNNVSNNNCRSTYGGNNSYGQEIHNNHMHIHSHNQTNDHTTKDFSNFSYTPKLTEHVNVLSDVRFNTNNRSNNNFQKNNNDNNRNEVISNVDTFERMKHDSGNGTTTKDLTCTTNETNISFQPITTFNNCQFQNTRMHNPYSNPVPNDMVPKTSQNYSDIKNCDKIDDDFFNSFEATPVVENKNEPLSGKKHNLRFFDAFVYDKKKNVNTEKDIFGHSSEFENKAFRDIKKRRKY